MKLKIFAIIFFLQLAFPRIAGAQVVINEINPFEEWVELYNLGETQVSLDGCTLFLDASYDPQKVVFTLSDVFSGKFKVVTWGGNWLNNGGDTVKIQCPTESDEISYGSNLNNKTFGRSPDGTGSFYVLESSSQGSANSNPQTSPSPTPTS